MRIEKIPIQTLASQLLSTLMQLFFSFEKDFRFVKTIIKTLACQLGSTHVQLLFLLEQDTRVKKTFIQTLAFQLSSTRLSTASPSPAMASPTRPISRGCVGWARTGLCFTNKKLLVLRPRYYKTPRLYGSVHMSIWRKAKGQLRAWKVSKQAKK